MTRFLYRSRSVAGTDVPASGVILLPNGTPPARGWPVVVWAHGTSGVARTAAPSLMKDLYYGWEGLLQWPLLGYAVVAPDYAGLGTNVPHQYRAYPGLDHDPLVFGSFRDQVRWVEDRFAGKPFIAGDQSPKTCR